MKKYDSLNPHSLLAILRVASHPLSLDELLRRANINRRLKREALATLHQLAGEGVLVYLHGGSWTMASGLKTIVGTLSVQRSGAAFVAPLIEGKNPRDIADIYISPLAVGDAWNGDAVEVTVLPGKRGNSREGRVKSVVKRAQTELTARVMRPARAASGRDSALCRPADARYSFDLLVDVAALAEAPQRGDLLRVKVGGRLPSPPDEPLWAGAAVRSLGREDDIAVQEQLTKLNFQIPLGFPPDVLAEAELVAASLPADKAAADIRDMPLVTIDGEDSRDFDDAICVRQLADGWRLTVAIADVALFVRPRGKMDNEARARGNSYYFPNSVEPMLPEALSNGICSLRPHKDRRVMVADMEFHEDGGVRSSTFYAGIMRSHARLTYGQVQAMLNGKSRDNWEKDAPGVPVMLDSAAKLATLLIKRRKKQGGLDFEVPEAEFVIENNKVTAVRNRERLFSHRLIEAFMISANEAVATFLAQKKVPLLYRVHPAPSREKLEILERSLQATELELPLPREVHDASWLPAMLEAAADTEQAFLVNRLTLRSMMQARYEPELEGHFGLGSECYCHFTSPIRRYSDLVVHRALRHSLGLDGGGPLPVGKKLLAVADICNSRERTAQDAEREITRRLGCLLLRDRVGAAFKGMISGVTHFGLFVELENMPLEGMVRVESLGADYFDYNPDRQELRGQRSGKSYRLGQPVEVRLTEVNLGRLEVTLTLLGLEEEPGTTQGARRDSSARKRVSSKAARRPARKATDKPRETFADKPKARRSSRPASDERKTGKGGTSGFSGKPARKKQGR